MILYPLHSSRSTLVHLTKVPGVFRSRAICGTVIWDGYGRAGFYRDARTPTCQRCIEKAAKLQKREVPE